MRRTMAAICAVQTAASWGRYWTAGSRKQEDVLHTHCFPRPADCCHSGTLLDFQNVELPEGDGSRAYNYSQESIGRAMEVREQC